MKTKIVSVTHEGERIEVKAKVGYNPMARAQMVNHAALNLPEHTDFPAELLVGDDDRPVTWTLTRVCTGTPVWGVYHSGSETLIVSK